VSIVGELRRGRGVCTVLTGLATLTTILAGAHSPDRIVAGLLLVCVLPAAAFDGLRGARWMPSAAGDLRVMMVVGLGLVLVLAVGFVMAVSPLGLRPVPVSLGIFIAVVCVDAGARFRPPPPAPTIGRRSIVALAIFTFAGCLAAAAFVIARNGAMTRSQEESNVVAYVVPSSPGYQLVVSNGAQAAEKVSIVARSGRSRPHRPIVVLLPPGGRWTARLFIRRAQRTGQIRVNVRIVSGSERGRVLNLTAPTPRVARGSTAARRAARQRRRR
jgi:hypothetical protein